MTPLSRRSEILPCDFNNCRPSLSLIQPDEFCEWRLQMRPKRVLSLLINSGHLIFKERPMFGANWKTTVFGLVSAFFSFIVFASESYPFPHWLRLLAKFVVVGGWAA
jgi:hypothetical protein